MTHANFQRFSATFKSLGIEQYQIDLVWNDLISKYSEPHRFYHTLKHIDRMLSSFDEIAVSEPAIEHAIWFHDAIYTPRSADNEDQSAEYFAYSFSHSLPPHHVDDVCRLILATDPRRERSMRADESLIRDIDLEILAASPSDYQDYTDAIRSEYSFVTDQEFRVGRSVILKRFLEMPIYTTEFFAHLEDTARRNLEGEIRQLQ